MGLLFLIALSSFLFSADLHGQLAITSIQVCAQPWSFLTLSSLTFLSAFQEIRAAMQIKTRTLHFSISTLLQVLQPRHVLAPSFYKSGCLNYRFNAAISLEH